MLLSDPVAQTRFKLVVTPLATSLVLLGPPGLLLPMTLLLLWAIVRCPGGSGALWQLRYLALIQGTVIGLLYLLRFGPSGLTAAGLIWGRMMLMLLPGLWFFLSTQSHQVVRGLRGILGSHQALILSTTLSLLPRLTREARELYQLQRLRGHPLAPNQFWHPKAWQALIKLVLLPLLIRMIRLSQQQATALQARGYRPDAPLTHFPMETHHDQTAPGRRHTSRCPGTADGGP
ncbi:CbiQ family ECF transporter T component [Ferrimonas futtsuensis]|uniref:CbiQ family ECF transporter T component n=1 Tax=Ferrimonas futtsuensis TaxID=364764 RepID=UPI0006885B6F|nr:CbiQ family ECF transporter T component [Ferrimonas futtsuensis]